MAATGSGKDVREEPPLRLRQQLGAGKQLLSRLLTRESSAAAPSFRVYYGVASAGSVPFLWESQPGTPKNDTDASAAAMPPLTPPPSYYVAGAGAVKVDARKAAGGGRRCKPTSTSILGSILPKIIMARRAARPAPSSSPSSFSFSSSSSSSSSSASSSSSSFRSAQSPACSSMRRSGGSSNRLHASSFSDEEELSATTCFRVRHESFRALKGCRVAMTVRSALASVGGGHGGEPSTASAQRA